MNKKEKEYTEKRRNWETGKEETLVWKPNMKWKFTKPSKRNKEMKRQDLTNIFKDLTKRDFKRGYAKGYRVGRAWEGKAWKKALKDWYSREKTGMETNL